MFSGWWGARVAVPKATTRLSHLGFFRSRGPWKATFEPFPKGPGSPWLGDVFGVTCPLPLCGRLWWEGTGLSCLPTWSPRPWAREQMVAGGGSHQRGLLETPKGCAWHRVPLLAPWSLQSHLKVPFPVWPQRVVCFLLKQLVGGRGKGHKGLCHQPLLWGETHYAS